MYICSEQTHNNLLHLKEYQQKKECNKCGLR